MNETLSDISESFEKVANDGFLVQLKKCLSFFKEMMTWENLFRLIGVVIIIFIIFFLYRLLKNGIKKIPEKKLPASKSQVILKFLKYFLYVCLTLFILSIFGINLKGIWGAAGIAGIAIGFAAQTTVSNLISGLFVATEGSIHLGDTIIVDGVTGVVDEINLLSVRLHTYDNQIVRIPNSSIINSTFINNSINKQRRITVTLDVTYDSDLNLALEVYKKAAASCPTVLKEPAPNAWVENFNDTGVDITVAAWFNNEDFLQTKSDLHIAILREMEAAGLDTPYPHMDISISKEDDIAIKNKVQKKDERVKNV